MLHHPKGWGMLLAIQCQRADHSRSKTRNMGATGRLSDALQGMSSARLETDVMQRCNHFWLSHSAGDIETKTAVHAPSSHDWGGQSCVVGALQRKKTQSGLYRKTGSQAVENSRRRLGGPGVLGEQLLELRQRRFGLSARVASLLVRKALT